MSNGLSAQSGPAFKNVVVEYIDNGNGIEVTPDTPLPVTGTFTTNPETPLDVNITNDSGNPVPITGDVNVTEPLSISYMDGATEVPVTPTEPLPVTINGTNIGLPEADPLPVFQPVSQGAFGDQITANLSQEISLLFNYGIDSDLVYTLSQNSASVSASNSRISLSTGTSSNSLALMKSKNYLRYRPGFGGLARFTLGVTTGVTGTEQTAGVGTEEDGFFFSYRDYEGSATPDMCIVRRYFGARETRYLTITTGSNSANNVTITLNGTVFTVAVSNNTGAANQTATNIVANFSSNAWTATAYGNIVCFEAVSAGTRGGSYSFSAGSTGVVATLSQKVAGTPYSEEVIPRSAWNYDLANGSGTLPLINWANGNVFQIKYQWLGYGMIQFYIEDPSLGRFIRVHAIEYANSNTMPTVGNPTFPFYFYANNGSTTSNISMFTASCGGFVEGDTKRQTGGNPKNYSVNGSCGSSGTLLANLLSPNNFKTKNSRIQVTITDISVSAADAVTFNFYRNSTFAGTASWSSIGTNSCMFYDTSSTSVSNGDLVCAIRAEHQTNNSLYALDFSTGIITLHPGDTLSIVAISDAGTVKVGCSINWIEYL